MEAAKVLPIESFQEKAKEPLFEDKERFLMAYYEEQKRKAESSLYHLGAREFIAVCGCYERRTKDLVDVTLMKCRASNYDVALRHFGKYVRNISEFNLKYRFEIISIKDAHDVENLYAVTSRD